MEKLIFKEEQAFRQSFIPWVLLPVWLVMFIVFGVGFYQQFYLSKPFGDNPMSNAGMIWSSVLSLGLITAVFLFILSGNLVTEIWTDGIRYKFPPLIRKMKFIPLSEIKTAEVGKYRPIAEFGGWGWRKRILTRKTAYNVSGNMGLRVIYKNGDVVLFGTRQPDELKRAVEKMWNRNAEKHAF